MVLGAVDLHCKFLIEMRGYRYSNFNFLGYDRHWRVPVDFGQLLMQGPGLCISIQLSRENKKLGKKSSLIGKPSLIGTGKQSSPIGEQ
jgi:hypothetical protein